MTWLNIEVCKATIAQFRQGFSLEHVLRVLSDMLRKSITEIGLSRTHIYLFRVTV